MKPVAAAHRLYVSARLRNAVKTSRHRGYELARMIGVHHSTLSCWICGISTPANPAPVIELGKLVGVRAADCFTKEPPQ